YEASCDEIGREVERLLRGFKQSGLVSVRLSGEWPPSSVGGPGAERMWPASSRPVSVAHVGDAVASSNGPSHVASLTKRLWLVLTTRLTLKFAGFGWAIKWIQQQSQHASERHPAPGELEATERVVATAAAFFPGRARCLEQSLVLYYLLRRRGIAVNYC